MSKSADHLPHGRQPFALNDLLLQLLLHRDVAHRDDRAAQLVFRIEQWAGRGSHGAPASVAVARGIVTGPEHLPARNHVAIQREQLGGIILLLLRLSFPASLLACNRADRGCANSRSCSVRSDRSRGSDRESSPEGSAGIPLAGASVFSISRRSVTSTSVPW